MKTAIIALTIVASGFSRTSQTPRDTRSTAPGGSGRLTGIVQTADTPPQAIRRAIVTVTGAELKTERQFVTDDTGRFLFEGLPAGRYSLTAEKPPFVKSYFGSRRPGRAPASPVVLAEGQTRDVVIALTRGAVIEGTILDENNAPLASAQVTVLQHAAGTGSRKLTMVPGVPQATTDERGRYRIHGLPAGEYSVSASAGVGLQGVFETTAAEIDAASRDRAPEPPAAGQLARTRRFFPGATEPGAAELFTLAAGDERTGVDITIPLVRAARFDGLSIGPDGQPMPNVWVVMTSGAERECWASPGLVRPDAAGRFGMAGIASGAYSLIARGAPGTATPSGGPSPMPLWAEVDFTMTGSDLSGVVLQFAQGMTVAGRATFAGSQPAPDPTKMKISVSRTDSSGCGEPTPMPSVAPSSDGAFVIEGLPPGRYRMTATGATTPWSLRSALLDGQDSLDAPFEVRQGQAVQGMQMMFTDQPAEISGVVSDSAGRPVHEYSVIVFPTDRALWTTSPRRLSGAIKLSSDGRYRLAGLPPGSYHIAVLTDIDTRQAGDSALLESLIPMSLTIALGEGEKKTQDLRIGG